jgi:nucleoside-diphosphate-sugar epimerase
MKKILITGGSGYFGSLLLKKLSDKGYICKIFDLVDAEDRPKNIEFIMGDIRDFNSINAAARDIDTVFHNVAQVPLAKNNKLFDSVNVLGTENILKASLCNQVNKVIYTSSSAVFGIPKANPVNELTIPTPMEEYGKAKYSGEIICEKYQNQGVDVTIIRPRTILGLGRLGIFQILFEWIREGYNIPVLGAGDNLYQFVHAEDLAEVCYLASLKKGSSVYNCGADNFGTMKQSLEALCNYANTGSKVKSIPKNLTIIGMRLTSFFGLSPLGAYHSLMYGETMYFDNKKVKAELDWSPKYSNIDMLIESYDWYLNNRHKISEIENASPHRSRVKQKILNLLKFML